MYKKEQLVILSKNSITDCITSTKTENTIKKSLKILN